VTTAHARSAGEVAAELDTDPGRGLAGDEAAARLGRYGRNELPERPPPTWLELIVRQLRDALVLLLLGAAAISIAVGDPLDSALIVAIVVLNTILGAVQEGRAESAAAAVRALLPARAHAVRDGAVRELDAAELVPGDVVVLKAGDHVPADGRVVEAHDADVDESLLTGESMPVSKRADPAVDEATPLAERATMAYSGTTVARGQARLVVTATGTETEAGRTAELGTGAAPATPLQQRLDRLAASLLRAIIAVCLVLTLLSWAHGEELTDALLTGVSLAVAAVPEGLAVVVTLTSALGVRRLARRRGIVRRLRAAETLGSVSVICTDKTGTLTTNRMAVDRVQAVTDDQSEDPETMLLVAGVLASDPSADPEDQAIATYASERGVPVDELHANAHVVGGHPFDSERKRMSVVIEDDEGRRTSYVKGAPEVILPRIASDEARTELERVAREWSSQGVRVLVVGARELEDESADEEDRLAARGAIGMWDPPRESAPPSVEAARRAGIRPVMVTGDHPRTAAAVAKLCGIGADGGPRVVSGPELTGTADMREVLTRAEAGDADAVLARDVYLHRLRAGIAAMAAALSGLDALVFTGGVGENSPAIRDAVCEGLAFLGVGASVEVLVVPAREELELAREARRVLSSG
jgi:P-type Ca2+ transporter type 2C